MKRYPFTRVILVSVIMGCLGCSDETSLLQKYIHEVKHRKAQAIESIPPFKPVESYTYPKDPLRRNPFKPYSMSSGEDFSAPDLKRPREPLEAFPLDALKMVGILKRKNRLWALVAAPQDKIYRIAVGNYLGRNHGKVIKISKAGLELIESIKVGDAWENKTTYLKIIEPDKTVL